MSAMVWVYPERKYEPFGKERWELSWEEVKASAKDKEEIDHDEDIAHKRRAFATKEAAMNKGRKLINELKTAYGQATVTRQVVGWFVEEDRVAEWQDTSDVEYVD